MKRMMTFVGIGVVAVAGCTAPEPTPRGNAQPVLETGTNRWTEGVIVRKDGRQIHGRIRWVPSTHEYEVDAGDLFIRFPANDVREVRLKEDQNQQSEGIRR